jgi:hypothetical protein
VTAKVMRLIDPFTGLMERKVCGAKHIANLKRAGHYRRGSWRNGCKPSSSFEKAKGDRQ